MVNESLKKQIDDFLEELDFIAYGGIGMSMDHPNEDEVKERIKNPSPTYQKGLRDGVILAKVYFKEMINLYEQAL